MDPFKTWRRDLKKRVDAGQDVAIDLRAGAALIREAGERAGRQAEGDARVLAGLADALEAEDRPPAERAWRSRSDDELALAHGPPRGPPVATVYPRSWAGGGPREGAVLHLVRDVPPLGRPRRGGTARSATARRACPTSRRWASTSSTCRPSTRSARRSARGRTTPSPPSRATSGSPWAIGAAEGGHKAILPELGTLEDFRRFVRTAGEHGIEIALDVAFQSSPDHPYVKEHPEWFRKRPDGTIQYAENPPKKYQDIYPFDFETEDWRELWDELKSVFDFWIGEGVRIFRVDNPHTKPFPFWEWMIARDQEASIPDVLFLSEAFTRPKIMYRLAKLGFTQSYNYFPWRNTALGADRVLHRADADARSRVLPPQPLAQHAGHPHRAAADRRPAGVRAAADPGRHARRQLRHLRPGVRADGAPAARAGERGVPGLGEVPAPRAGTSTGRTACAS